MKKLFITMLVLFAIQTTQAQAHQMGAYYNCKLKKRNPGTEGYSCEACTAIYKKEQDAKIAEDKRRFAAAQAEAEAKKAASEKVRLAKLVEAEKNAESGKVVVNIINGNQSVVNTNNAAKPKLAKNVTDNTVMIDFGENAFKNENGEIILQNQEWSQVFSFAKKSVSANYCKNLGIVRFGDKNFYRSDFTFYFDIVNSKGEYLLNDKNIRHIVHIIDDWLLINTFDLTYYFYDINTKNKIQLDKLEMHDSYHPGVIIPIFPHSTVIQDNQFWESSVVYNANLFKQWKEALIYWSSSKINEEIISKYSFCLLYTNFSRDEYRNKSTFETSDIVRLYCLTKNGELEVINLK